MLLFLVGSILSAIMEGGGGMVTTRLTASANPTDVTLSVSNTQGFLKSDYVTIGNEKIRYTNKTDTSLTGCTRGYDETTAASHSRGSKVYSPDSSVLNSALGFNIASTGSSVGAIGIPVLFMQFATVTLPRLISWDFSWLKTSDGMQYLRIILQAISVGFIVYIAYLVASMLGGIMQGIFTR